MWRLSHICKHKHLNSKYIRLTTCFSDIARGKEGWSTCLLTSPDSCSRICNFSAFGHKTWNAICPTTCLEMDLFQFSWGICGDIFAWFANPCPTTCSDDFFQIITFNNRRSAELLYGSSSIKSIIREPLQVCQRNAGLQNKEWTYPKLPEVPISN